MSCHHMYADLVGELERKSYGVCPPSLHADSEVMQTYVQETDMTCTLHAKEAFQGVRGTEIREGGVSGG